MLYTEKWTYGISYQENPGEAEINGLKWHLGWREDARVLGEVRENGRAGCPVPRVLLPLLIHSVLCPISHHNFTPQSPPAYGGPLVAPSQLPHERDSGWQMFGGGGGLSWSCLGMAPPMLSCDSWRGKRGRERLTRGRLKPPDQPSASPLPPVWAACWLSPP